MAQDFGMGQILSNIMESNQIPDFALKIGAKPYLYRLNKLRKITSIYGSNL